MNDQYINEQVLEHAAVFLFGEDGAEALRRLYNSMSDLAETVADDVWRDGHETGVRDGIENERFSGDFAEAAERVSDEDEDEAADAAQSTMEAIWGGLSAAQKAHGERVAARAAAAGPMSREDVILVNREFSTKPGHVNCIVLPEHLRERA